MPMCKRVRRVHYYEADTESSIPLGIAIYVDICSAQYGVPSMVCFVAHKWRGLPPVDVWYPYGDIELL